MNLLFGSGLAFLTFLATMLVSTAPNIGCEENFFPSNIKKLDR